MPINMQGVEYDLEFQWYCPTHDDHIQWHQIIINDMIAQKPVQLHFEFYNERHDKPKKSKNNTHHLEYLCPF